MGVTPIQAAMTRDRFINILSNLHLNDNNKMNKNNQDKLLKVRPTIDHVNSKLIEKSHAQNISVDESGRFPSVKRR